MIFLHNKGMAGEGQAVREEFLFSGRKDFERLELLEGKLSS